MITGRNPIVRLRFDNGMELRCTPGHKVFTTNRGYVEAQHLTADDQVRTLDLPAPASNADWRMPVSSDPRGIPPDRRSLGRAAAPVDVDARSSGTTSAG